MLELSHVKNFRIVPYFYGCLINYFASGSVSPYVILSGWFFVVVYPHMSVGPTQLCPPEKNLTVALCEGIAR